MTDTATTPKARPAGARPRRAMLLTLLAVSLAVTAALVGTAGPASAYVWTNGGGLIGSTYSCDSFLHQSSVTAAAYPERGWASQTVEVRFKYYRYNTGRWSVGPWQRFRTGQALYNSWVSTRGKWAIYAQYHYWRGNGWSPIVEERLQLTQIGLVPGTSTTGWTCRT